MSYGTYFNESYNKSSEELTVGDSSTFDLHIQQWPT